MERLHKSCRKLIWLNPLLRYDDFEPLATGVRLMLPHVDAFLPAHNLDSLVDLARALAPGRSDARIQQETRTMDMTGEQLIPLPQQRVWEALNDPEVLKACIPGCESIEKVSDTEYKVAMTAAVGPVKAKFSGKLLLSDLNPPNSYSLAFEGSGGAAGFGKGGAQVSLAPEAGGTKLAYTAKATVGGKLAQVGSRLIDAASRKMADDFFSRFNETVAPPRSGRSSRRPRAEEAGSALGVGRARDRRGCADRVLGAARSLTLAKARISPQSAEMRRAVALADCARPASALLLLTEPARIPAFASGGAHEQARSRRPRVHRDRRRLRHRPGRRPAHRRVRRHAQPVGPRHRRAGEDRQGAERQDQGAHRPGRRVQLLGRAVGGEGSPPSTSARSTAW